MRPRSGANFSATDAAHSHAPAYECGAASSRPRAPTRGQISTGLSAADKSHSHPTLPWCQTISLSAARNTKSRRDRSRSDAANIHTSQYVISVWSVQSDRSERVGRKKLCSQTRTPSSKQAPAATNVGSVGSPGTADTRQHAPLKQTRADRSQTDLDRPETPDHTASTTRRRPLMGRYTRKNYGIGDYGGTIRDHAASIAGVRP